MNEAYLKLAGSDCPIEGRKHFYAMAARAMRQILIDYLRSRTSAKRSPAGRLLEVDEVVDQLGTRNVDLLALDEALIRLAGSDRRKARVVELRFFGGLDNARTAEVLGVSRATIERDWVFARAWLRRELDAEASDGR